jgi:DNA-binding ferritin-like protein
MNGTSAQSLYDQAEAAYNALQEAMRQMQQAAPNGRDYYPQAAGAMERAQDEHFDRLRRVQALMAEYEQVMEHCSDAMARSRR